MLVAVIVVLCFRTDVMQACESISSPNILCLSRCRQATCGGVLRSNAGENLCSEEAFERPRIFTGSQGNKTEKYYAHRLNGLTAFAGLGTLRNSDRCGKRLLSVRAKRTCRLSAARLMAVGRTFCFAHIASAKASARRPPASHGAPGALHPESCSTSPLFSALANAVFPMRFSQFSPSVDGAPSWLR